MGRRDIAQAVRTRLARAGRDDAGSVDGPPEDVLHYPYGSMPLLPAWGSVKGQSLAALAAAGAVLGAGRGLAAGWAVNEAALLALLPGALAFTLAFAPEPRTRLGTMAKDLLCLGTILATQAGHAVHLLVPGVPVLLAVAVALDRWLPPGLRVPARYRLQGGRTAS